MICIYIYVYTYSHDIRQTVERRSKLLLLAGRKRNRRGWGVVAIGALRCFKPQVVANHLLGLKDSKLRADMGLRLHWLQPTTGVGATDVKVTLVSLLLIFLAFL